MILYLEIREKFPEEMGEERFLRTPQVLVSEVLDIADAYEKYYKLISIFPQFAETRFEKILHYCYSLEGGSCQYETLIV